MKRRANDERESPASCDHCDIDRSGCFKCSCKNADLTTREREVLQLAANGNTAKTIANKIGVSRKTVEAHLTNARNKTGARSTLHLVAMAIRQGVIVSLIGVSIAHTIAPVVSLDVLRPARVGGRMMRASRGRLRRRDKGDIT